MPRESIPVNILNSQHCNTGLGMHVFTRKQVSHVTTGVDEQRVPCWQRMVCQGLRIRHYVTKHGEWAWLGIMSLSMVSGRGWALCH